MPWGTALFYQVYVAKEIVSLGGLVALTDREPLVIGRVVVYVSALGALTAVFLLGRALFDAWTGRVAALLLAVSPGFAITAHYFKVEVPMLLWLLLATLVTFRARRTGRLRDAVAAGLLAGYAASTQYSGAVVVLAVFTALVQSPLHVTQRVLAIVSGAVAAGFLVGTPYALLTPWRLYDALRMDVTINRQGPAYTPGRPLAWLDYPLHVLPFALTMPLLIAAAVGLIVAIRTEGRRLLPLWVLLGAYALLLGLDNSRIVRATVPLLPFACLFAAHALGRLRRRSGCRIPSIVIAAGIASFGFVFTLAYVQVMAKQDPRINASLWIQHQIARGTPIAQSTTHYLDVPQLREIGYPTIEVAGNVQRLASADSRYLVLSDMELLPVQQALSHHPQAARFLAYIKKNYCEVVHFENSQSIMGVNAKVRGAKLPFDWLYPNPRITVLERRGFAAQCARFTG